MLENLIDLVRQHAGEAIVNNPAIPNDRNEEAIREASGSITGGLQNLLSQGGLQDVLKLFSGNTDVAASGVTQQVSGGFIQTLMSKFGLDQQTAGQVAGQVVPRVMTDLVNKTNDPAEKGFDIQGLFNHLSGGSTGSLDMQGLLNKVKGGLDLNGDGQTDLQDLKAAFQGQAGGGGLMDKIKGIFG
ncbi:MAG TPA: hypothetical protein VG870_14070 [Chitinophagaceae bacterium]|nr:hypothetical protein [Chitinophagaceae bacterium]